MDKQDTFNINHNIKVIGVGGGGNNTLNFLKTTKYGNQIQMFALNTDEQALRTSCADNKIPIGASLTQGLGAGSIPSVGKKAAIESRDEIDKILDDTDLLFIAAGMGGGTGTGAAPEIAKYAQEKGILTIAVVTTPFLFEGKMRMDLALQGVKELRENTDVCLVISNQNLVKNHGEEYVEDSFKLTDTVLETAINALLHLLESNSNLGNNLTINDFMSLFKDAGFAMISIEESFNENLDFRENLKEALIKAVQSDMLEVSMSGATTFILEIAISKNISFSDLYNLPAKILYRLLGYDQLSAIKPSDVNVKIIPVVDQERDDTGVKVTLIATKFKNQEAVCDQILNNTESEMNGAIIFEEM